MKRFFLTGMFSSSAASFFTLAVICRNVKLVIPGIVMAVICGIIVYNTKAEKEEKAVVNAQIVAVDINTFRAGMESQGKTIWETILNGLPCLQFNVEAEGVTTSCFAFGTEQGSVVVFGFTLSNQEPYASLYKVMASSIQLAE